MLESKAYKKGMKLLPCLMRKLSLKAYPSNRIRKGLHLTRFSSIIGYKSRKNLTVVSVLILCSLSVYFSPTVRTQRCLAGSGMGERSTYDTDNTMYQKNDPSHIEMCRHFIPRVKDVLLKKDFEAKAKDLGIDGLNLLLDRPISSSNSTKEIGANKAIVKEDKMLCDPSLLTPSSALIQVMSSSLISEASSRLGLNVWYQYQCPSLLKNDHFLYAGSIQDVLFHELSSEKGQLQLISMDNRALENLCTNCLLDFYELQHKQFHGMNCILFPKPTVETDKEQIGIKTLLPVLREAMVRASERWSKEISKSEHLSIIQTRFAEQDLKTEDELEDIANGYQNDDLENEEDEKLTASIYLSCPFESCSKLHPVFAMKFHLYAENIPYNTAIISIIVSETCSLRVKGCMAHGQSLFSYLTDKIPDARVELIQASNIHTFASFSKMANSDLLICPPGQGCIIPALFMKESSTALLASDKTTPEWFKELPLDDLGISLLSEDSLELREVSDLDLYFATQ